MRVTSLKIAKARIRSQRNSGYLNQSDYEAYIKTVRRLIKEGLDKPSVRNGIPCDMAPIFKPISN